MKMTPLDKATYLLVVIGGLNWGLIGFFKYDFVTRVFGTGFGRFIFAVVGLSALYCAWGIVKMMSEQKKTV